MKLTITGDRAVLDSRATPRLMAVLSRLEGPRSWLKAGGLSLSASGHNVEVLTEALPDLEVVHSDTESHQRLAEEFAPVAGAYKPKTQPYAHQRRALERARQRPAFALFMEQGTGKTKVAIDRAGELWAEGAITGVLVVAKKGVHRQWIENQLPEHFGGRWSGSFFEGGKVHQRHSEPDGLQWFAINFDGAKTPKGKAACLAFLSAHRGRVMIIGDETQEIKNSRSARFKAMMELKAAAAAPYRMALTGTPIAKDLTDEWAQLKWLNEDILGIRYVTAFRAEYCIMGGFEGRAVVGHKNIEKFRAKVDPHTFRATKDELGLEAKVHRRWTVDLPKEQRQVMTQLRQDLRHRLETGEVVRADHAATALIKIQQASHGFVVKEDGEVVELVPLKKNARVQAVLEILDAYPGKTVVWARFRHDIAMLARALAEHKVSYVEYHGGTSDQARGLAVKSFLDPEGARVFLSTPQAGGTGLNLQGLCSHAVYFSNGFNAIDRWQSEDRIHRIGTKGQVVYTDLYARGSVDALIASNLKRKKGINELAIGDIAKALEEEAEWDE